MAVRVSSADQAGLLCCQSWHSGLNRPTIPPDRNPRHVAGRTDKVLGLWAGAVEAPGRVGGRCDQAIKGVRWMSWRQEAMKDVVACDKPRGAGKQASILGFLNGATHPKGYRRLNV